jgi:hypothetical protein
MRASRGQLHVRVGSKAEKLVLICCPQCHGKRTWQGSVRQVRFVQLRTGAAAKRAVRRYFTAPMGNPSVVEKFVQTVVRLQLCS